MRGEMKGDRQKQTWMRKEARMKGKNKKRAHTFMHRYPGASRMRGDSCWAPSPRVHAAQLASNVHLIMRRFLPVDGRPATQQKIWTLITARDNCRNYKHKYGARARPLIRPCGLHLSSFLFLIYSLVANAKRRSEWLVRFSDATSEQWRIMDCHVRMAACKLFPHYVEREHRMQLHIHTASDWD